MFQKNINKFEYNLTFDIQERIDRAILMTPKEYCDKWVSQKTGIQPDEWGYTSACVRELSNVLGLSEVAIRKWGRDFDKHPDYVRVNLGNIDKLNDIKDILARI